MDNANEISPNLNNPFFLNQRDSNLEQGLNNFIPNLENGQLGQDINNQGLSPLQPNNSSSFLSNQLDNISEKEKEEDNNNYEAIYEVGNESENKKNIKGSKRRSKSEIEGRTFECKICHKRYLSYPALYTHCLQKHKTNNSSGRGRGRPKNKGQNPKQKKINSILSIIHLLKKKKELELQNLMKSIIALMRHFLIYILKNAKIEMRKGE